MFESLHCVCCMPCRPGSKAAKAAAAAAGTTADWVQKGPRMNPTSSLLAAAVSSDGKFLAVGGGDKMVHVFEAGTGTHVQVSSALCLPFRWCFWMPKRDAKQCGKLGRGHTCR
jgi:hypothetical protein